MNTSVEPHETEEFRVKNIAVIQSRLYTLLLQTVHRWFEFVSMRFVVTSIDRNLIKTKIKHLLSYLAGENGLYAHVITYVKYKGMA